MQRETSIEDQVRRCREYAARQGWSVVEPFVIADKAVSDAAVAGRDGLQRLVSAAKSKGREFDCLLIDDTSRLARDISDALRTFKTLEFHGVAVVSVSQGIDSSQGNARPLLAMHGIMDEQYLTDLAKKVHRGQEGRALNGYTTGGRVYGYNNVPIEDPARKGRFLWHSPSKPNHSRRCCRSLGPATLSEQCEKFRYGQSRKFLLKSASLEGGRRTGVFVANAEAN